MVNKMSLIEFNNVKKIYGKSDAKTIALDDITLSIDSGEMVAFMGASGSGKSTLLNIMGCLDKQSSGEYYYNGEKISNYTDGEISRLRNSVFGFVVQNFALIDNYTVYENVEIPLAYNKKRSNNKMKLIKETLNMLGIVDKINKYPKELSGGQCQRVAIARAIVNDQQIILADEPTGALDKKTGQEVMNIFKDLNKQGKTIVIITHDNAIASQCSRIIKLSDGKIISS